MNSEDDLQVPKQISPCCGGGRKRWLRVVLVLFIVAMIAGEMFARFYLGLGDPPLSIVDEQLEYRFKPGVYHRFGKTISYNIFSMRSGPVTPQKLDANSLRVLVLGDSVINGGALTDDRDLATTRLQRDLSHSLKRPVFVGNISAGSWGPPNQFAYLKKFGWFDADAIVLVLSSHDGADAQEYVSLVGSASFPDTAPSFALVELISRYSGLGKWFAVAPSDALDVPGGATSESLIPARQAQCRAAILAILNESKTRGVPAYVALHTTRDEIAGTPDSNREIILQAAKDAGVLVIDMSGAFADSLKTGKDPYRPGDNVHPNEIGQQLIADALKPILLKSLQASVEKP